METYENVFQYPFSVIDNVPFEMRGHWREQYFHNDHPIVLELGCGKGEYTVELAKLYPDVNFIGVDIKGARMWTGATQALKEGLKNVAFLRTNIEIIERFFAEDEVQEIWLTFSDPQMKNPPQATHVDLFHGALSQVSRRWRHHPPEDRLNFLFTYTTYMVEKNHLPVIVSTTDLYAAAEILPQEATAIQTYYESMWIARGLNIKYMKWQLPRTTKPSRNPTWKSNSTTIAPITVRSAARSTKQNNQTAKQYEKAIDPHHGSAANARHGTNKRKSRLCRQVIIPTRRSEIQDCRPQDQRSP